MYYIVIKLHNGDMGYFKGVNKTGVVIATLKNAKGYKRKGDALNVVNTKLHKDMNILGYEIQRK